MEIYGREAKLDIQGLGGSYGVERLAFYRMLPQMGPPETTVWEYPGEDRSWQLELADFETGVKSGKPCGPSLARCPRSFARGRNHLPAVATMIITRSPLRLSLGGGGTDLPSYYRRFGGFLVAAAIDKYVYITLHQTFERELIVKYSQLERVSSVDQVQHPIVREALRLVGNRSSQFGDHQHGRHSRRHRSRIVRQLHYRSAESAARLSKEPGASRGTRGAGLRHRTREAG